MKYGLIPQSPIEENALKQRPHARVLFDPFLPVVVAHALMAFVRLGLVRSLDKSAKDPAALAAELGLSENGVRHLLRVLAASGYVSIVDGESSGNKEVVELTPLSRATLLECGPVALDAWVLFNGIHWRALSTLEQVLRVKGDRDLHHHLENEDEWKVYQRAMLQTARPVAKPVAELIPEPAGRTLLLDLGGSHGLYGAAICRRFAPMKSRVIDLPEAVIHGRRLGEKEGITDIVEYEQGDIQRVDFGNKICDVVFMGNIAHHFTDDGLVKLLCKVRRALKPGGVVAIWDIAPPPELPELDLVAEGFSMLFYLTSASECRAPAVMGNMLTDCGFTQIEVLRGPAPIHVLTTGRC